MDKLQAVLNNIIALSVGVSLGSLLITHSENYKVAIPVLLATIIVKLALYYKNYIDR